MAKPSVISIVLLLTAFIQTAPSQQIPNSQVSSPGILRDQIYSALLGSWTGQLEYRDFQNDKRVVLPTWLQVKATADGQSLDFSYTYDDGPAKTVTESSTVAIDAASSRFTLTSDRDHSSDTYQISAMNTGRDAAKTGGRKQFTLTGTGKENDKAVDVRITVTIDRNLYRFEKETRLPGKDFNFRDGYVMTRRTPLQ